jgi:hypothetical protein
MFDLCYLSCSLRIISSHGVLIKQLTNWNVPYHILAFLIDMWFRRLIHNTRNVGNTRIIVFLFKLVKTIVNWCLTIFYFGFINYWFKRRTFFLLFIQIILKIFAFLLYPPCMLALTLQKFIEITFGFALICVRFKCTLGHNLAINLVFQVIDFLVFFHLDLLRFVNNTLVRGLSLHPLTIPESI